ncbi:PxKF domain-containing protein [Luteitalea sp.]|uniref:PxKF domain-containing protein n=1 Tax=Luteitalea sp. TaxID=2004800 RepID=UPI0025C0B1AF|nr:PxKF domain-containing protein [Luteitalea sp.]
MGTIDVDVPFQDLPAEVTIASSDRLSTLREGNDDRPFRLATTIDLTAALRSPVLAPLPRIAVRQNAPNVFAVPLVAPVDMETTVEFSAASASLLTTPVPVGTCSLSATCTYPEPPPFQRMTLTPEGLASWTPILSGLYAVQFTATSTSRSLTRRQVSAVLDTVVEVVTDCSPFQAGCVQRPWFTTEAAPARVKVGEELVVPFAATGLGTTTIAAIDVPTGAQLVETSSGLRDVTAELRWTPTLDDLGVHFACVQALNALNQPSFGVHCPLIEVWRDPVITYTSQLPLAQAVEPQAVPIGTAAVPPPAPASRDAGWYFVGWTLDPTASITAPLFPFGASTITEDLTLHAVWTDQLRTVTYVSEYGQPIPARLVPLGALAGEAPEPCCPEDRFEGWFLDEARTRPFRFDTDRIYDDTTLFAKWTTWVTVYLSGATGGCRNTSGFAPLTFTCTPGPIEGWTFDGWYVNGDLTRPYRGEPVVSSVLFLFARWSPVRVPYVFTGFLAPVENLPVLNVGQAGRTIPIKWRLARPEGTPVTALSSFVSLTESAVACDASPDSVLEEQLAESTAGGLRYDAEDDVFIFNWKTQKGVTGCRVVTVTLDDGERYVARFKLR